MLFNSGHFLLFFPIVVCIYFACPKRVRHVWLLVASYYFYMSWSAKYAALIAFSTAATYFCGLLVEKVDTWRGGTEEQRRTMKKVSIAVCMAVNLGILFFFKYSNFTIDSINSILLPLHVSAIERFQIVLPVGISFYTFQALSYVVDVYRGEIRAEKNILKYALFVSFFPQLVAGPIERSKNLLLQITELSTKKLLNYDRIANGLTVMLWGYFMKMMISDRAAILVDTVYNAWENYGATELIAATLLFAVQIYCDFAGYSLIAIGAAQVMGFQLMENFDVPYFSRSIKEFWRRWHISLSSWFRDYLYIPLGGNRCGTVRKYVNVMLTFLCSGLWHGASWTFVIWGGLHGLYQVLGQLLAPVKQRVCKALGVRTEAGSYQFGQILTTFLLTSFAWIFFRANSLSDAAGIIHRICTAHNPWALTDGTLYTLGLDHAEIVILLLSVTTLLLVDLAKYFSRKRIDQLLQAQNLAFRWGCLIAAVMSIAVFGVYGNSYDAQAFIYFQF